MAPPGKKASGRLSRTGGTSQPPPDEQDTIEVQSNADGDNQEAGATGDPSSSGDDDRKTPPADHQSSRQTPVPFTLSDMGVLIDRLIKEQTAQREQTTRLTSQLIALVQNLTAQPRQSGAALSSPTPPATLPVTTLSASPPTAPPEEFATPMPEEHTFTGPAPVLRSSTVDTASSLGSSQRLKKDDIGIFHPDNPRDDDNNGIIHDGKLTVYTDVYIFTERLKSLQTNYSSPSTDATNITLLQLASGCFQGTALQ